MWTMTTHARTPWWTRRPSQLTAINHTKAMPGSARKKIKYYVHLAKIDCVHTGRLKLKMRDLDWTMRELKVDVPRW